LADGGELPINFAVRRQAEDAAAEPATPTHDH
jgi:hypothetical protein